MVHAADLGAGTGEGSFSVAMQTEVGDGKHDVLD
jgi:hypothetical protein